MKINLQKYIADLLPTGLRRLGNIEFIRSLLQQVASVYGGFNRQVSDWLYKAHADASVLSLQHHIRREFDVDAAITELNGKPLDFLVTVTGAVDENALRAFIDKYKLAGKSFSFVTGNVSYTAEWLNHQCEIVLNENAINISRGYDYEGEHYNGLFFVPDFPPASDIVISYRIIGYYNHGTDIEEFIAAKTTIIESGLPAMYLDAQLSIILSGAGGNYPVFFEGSKIEIISVAPISDTEYTYTFTSGVQDLPNE